MSCIMQILQEFSAVMEAKNVKSLIMNNWPSVRDKILAVAATELSNDRVQRMLSIAGNDMSDGMVN